MIHTFPTPTFLYNNNRPDFVILYKWVVDPWLVQKFNKKNLKTAPKNYKKKENNSSLVKKKKSFDCVFFLSFLFLSLFLWFLLPFYSFTTHTNTTGIHSNSFWWVNTEKLNKKHKILLFTTSNFYLWTCMTTTRSNIIVANVVEDVLIFGKIIGWSTPFSTAIYHDGTKKKTIDRRFVNWVFGRTVNPFIYLIVLRNN